MNSKKHTSAKIKIFYLLIPILKPENNVPKFIFFILIIIS